MQNVCVHPAVWHSWDVQPSPYELGVYAQEKKLNKEKKKHTLNTSWKAKRCIKSAQWKRWKSFSVTFSSYSKDTWTHFDLLIQILYDFFPLDWVWKLFFPCSPEDLSFKAHLGTYYKAGCMLSLILDMWCFTFYQEILLDSALSRCFSSE